MPSPDASAARPLTGRHALVTGASRGIGAAIAAALTAAGAHVTLQGRDEAALRGGAERGIGAGLVACDVTDTVAVERALAAAVDQGGPIDLLINNAGSAESGRFLKTDPAVFERMFAVHVLGAVHTSRFVLPGMIERRFGRIVNIGSTASLKGHGYIAAYCTAKHALLGLTRALAVETAQTGVTVNAVCPGYTETDMVRESFEKTAAKTGRTVESILKDALAGNPMQRLVQPDEVAAAVVYLCGPAAGAVTGSALTIDGGETAG